MAIQDGCGAAMPHSGQGLMRPTGWDGSISRLKYAISVGDLCAFAQQVRDRGITDILLLGMGGSSLCPEVLAMTFGCREGWPRLHVLDSTIPAQVQRFADAVNLETTLCVVASKSGTTTEPHAFCEFFWAKMQ